MDRSDNENENDELKLNSDASLKKLLAPDGSTFCLYLNLKETIMLSCKVYKYNKRLKRQERTLLITSRYLYNIDRQGFFAKIGAVFSASSQIKRKIDICKIGGITMSEVSSEFVIHVPEEYDYRYGSPDKRDKILLCITRVYSQCTNGSMLAFYFKAYHSL